MPPLRIEVYSADHHKWYEAGTINPGDPYGSISDNTEQGRDIYYFGVDMLEGKAVIKKNDLGVDIEIGPTRVIHGLGETTLLASLDPGEEFEMEVKTDVSKSKRRIKFTHLAE